MTKLVENNLYFNNVCHPAVNHISKCKNIIQLYFPRSLWTNKVQGCGSRLLYRDVKGLDQSATGDV